MQRKVVSRPAAWGVQYVKRRRRDLDMGKTLSEKVWDEHVVRSAEGEPDLLFIDLHLIHEVTSPQAFDGLRLAGGPYAAPTSPWPPRTTTSPRSTGTSRSPTRSRGPRSRRCARNAEEFGVRLHPLGDVEQGIVHIIGPQLGLTQPGHDDRVRRLAHLHPRRLRCDRLRHRHLRGRARARHPDADRRRGPRRWPSPSTAACPTASPPRTWC